MGENWEWTTDIFVQRDGEAQRNSIKDIDESEIFKGTENSLKMEQIYTRAFQCVFKLAKYPFDTQVCFFQIISSFELCF